MPVNDQTIDFMEKKERKKNLGCKTFFMDSKFRNRNHIISFHNFVFLKQIKFDKKKKQTNEKKKKKTHSGNFVNICPHNGCQDGILCAKKNCHRNRTCEWGLRIVTYNYEKQKKKYNGNFP